MFEILNDYDCNNHKSNKAIQACENIPSIEVTDEITAKEALSASLHIRKLRCSMVEKKQAITKSFLMENEKELLSLKVMIDSLQETEDQLKSQISNWLYEKNKNSQEKIAYLEVDNGKLFCKDEWSFEIKDLESVPRKYMTVDYKKIEEDVKKGIRNLQGISIFQAPSITFRIKN